MAALALVLVWSAPAQAESPAKAATKAATTAALEAAMDSSPRGGPVIAVGPAIRDAGAQVIDLRVRRLPLASLAMRPTRGSTVRGAGRARPTSTSTAGAERVAQADAELAGEGRRQDFQSGGYKAIPTTARDIQERVIFKFNVGYGLDSGPTSGDPFRSGFIPDQITDPDGNAYAQNRHYLLGDAVLGTKGVLLPSLNTYFLSRYQADVVSGASEFASLTSTYDTQPIQVNAGYAEIADIRKGATVFGNLFLRAGRQYRYGSAAFVTNFDGVTGALDLIRGFEVSGFFGLRAAQYLDDDRGVLGGGSVKVRGKDLVGLPFDLNVDYLFFGGHEDAEDLGLGAVNLARQYIEANARVVVGSSRLYLRGRVVDNGSLRDEGIGLGRLGVQLRQAFGRKLLLVADAEQVFAREVAYDYISPVASDVVDIPSQIGIGLDPPVDSTRLGLRLNAVLSPAFELYAFGRANLVLGEGSQSGFNQPYQEGGAALSARLGSSVFPTAQYKIRLHQLDDAGNEPGSAFFDTSGSGVTLFHEISGELRLRFGQRKLSAALGGYFRIYSLQTPYAEVEEDARAGARADVGVWFSPSVRLKVAGEFAQPSPTLAPELANLLSIRVLTEAIF